MRTDNLRVGDGIRTTIDSPLAPIWRVVKIDKENSRIILHGYGTDFVYKFEEIDQALGDATIYIVPKRELKVTLIKKEGKMKLTPYGHRPNALTGRIDMLLYRGEHTFREIADILDCPLSKLSAHMDKLRKMGFIVRVDRRTMKIRVQKITVVRKTTKQEEDNGMMQTARSEQSGTQAARMNACLAQGMTLEQISEAVNLPISRIKGHIRHLLKKGNVLIETNGVWKLE